MDAKYLKIRGVIIQEGAIITFYSRKLPGTNKFVRNRKINFYA